MEFIKIFSFSIILHIFFSTGALSGDSSGNASADSQIRKQIIKSSIQSYPGNCPCPYNLDRAGRKCGKRSAWSRPGGYAPLCYDSDVSDEMVKQYRKQHSESAK